MSIILGIDPGSRITGYGVLKMQGLKPQYVASGCIRADLKKPTAERLKQIYDGISEVCRTYLPETAAIERIFFAHNADSALKLGQARGVAMAAMAGCVIPVSEYTARQIKQAVVGTGAAEKSQVQHMVKELLKLNKMPPADAADALAVAFCHSQSEQSLLKMGGLRGIKHHRYH